MCPRLIRASASAPQVARRPLACSTPGWSPSCVAQDANNASIWKRQFEQPGMIAGSAPAQSGQAARSSVAEQVDVGIGKADGRNVEVQQVSLAAPSRRSCSGRNTDGSPWRFSRLCSPVTFLVQVPHPFRVPLHLF